MASEALPLPHGQAIGALRADLVQLEPPEHLGNPSTALGRVNERESGRASLEMAGHCQSRVQAGRAGRDEPDPTLILPSCPIRGEPVDSNDAGVGCDETRDHAQERRLADPVVSDDERLRSGLQASGRGGRAAGPLDASASTHRRARGVAALSGGRVCDAPVCGCPPLGTLCAGRKRRRRHRRPVAERSTACQPRSVPTDGANPLSRPAGRPAMVQSSLRARWSSLVVDFTVRAFRNAIRVRRSFAPHVSPSAGTRFLAICCPITPRPRRAPTAEKPASHQPRSRPPEPSSHGLC